VKLSQKGAKADRPGSREHLARLELFRGLHTPPAIQQDPLNGLVVLWVVKCKTEGLQETGGGHGIK